MTSQEIAGHASRQLREALADKLWPETIDALLHSWRSGLAQQLAEEATGVTFGEARLLSRYSASALTRGQIDAARRYRTALLDAYQRLPERVPELLTVLDDLAAQPVAA